jgi:hypothetical protein
MQHLALSDAAHLAATCRALSSDLTWRRHVRSATVGWESFCKGIESFCGLTDLIFLDRYSIVFAGGVRFVQWPPSLRRIRMTGGISQKILETFPPSLHSIEIWSECRLPSLDFKHLPLLERLCIRGMEGRSIVLTTLHSLPSSLTTLEYYNASLWQVTLCDPPPQLWTLAGMLGIDRQTFPFPFRSLRTLFLKIERGGLVQTHDQVGRYVARIIDVAPELQKIVLHLPGGVSIYHNSLFPIVQAFRRLCGRRELTTSAPPDLAVYHEQAPRVQTLTDV